MNNEIKNIHENDYIGADRLLYCGKCHSPKEMRLSENSFFGSQPLPIPCNCRKEMIDSANKEIEQVRHLERVEQLKREGFTDPAMREWTFENDNGHCPRMIHARKYADNFEEMERLNLGCLLWGAVGTGKSYFAGCIANALMEKEIPVRMTNFALILNDLNSIYDSRNSYIDKLNRCRLLIIDDFGMERGTEYGLEQIYNVIDSRYRSRKPLIVTTNLTLAQLQNPQDTAHARIYDRVLDMCTPICFSGENLRRADAREKLEQYKSIVK